MGAKTSKRSADAQKEAGAGRVARFGSPGFRRAAACCAIKAHELEFRGDFIKLI
jgi:hypothetical protein